jgi:hypothetical protein|tara:strand:- start:49 stop:732 length:684 start_codon:yes stop_codon:yes gene_type:complete
MKSKVLLVSMLLVLTLLSLGAYLKFRSDSVLADAALEIGVGGFHREISLRDDIDPTADLFGQIESVSELLSILDLRYTIDRQAMPRLISRVKKTQKRSYGAVVVLTVEAQTEGQALEYLSTVIDWTLVRHEALFEQRVSRVVRFNGTVEDAVAHGACLGAESSAVTKLSSTTELTEMPWCAQRTLPERIAILAYLRSLPNSLQFKKTQVLLNPTVRNRRQVAGDSAG